MKYKWPANKVFNFAVFRAMSEGIKIRHAKEEEVKRIADIEKTCFPAAEAAQLKDFQDRFNSFPENFFVAVDESLPTDPQNYTEIIGFINGCNNDAPDLPDELYHDASLHKKDGKYQTVFGIDVIPDYQRRGVGALLMKRYIEWAKETGKRGLILTCKDRLVHWYEKFGYKNVGVSASCHGGAKWNDMQIIF